MTQSHWLVRVVQATNEFRLLRGKQTQGQAEQRYHAIPSCNIILPVNAGVELLN